MRILLAPDKFKGSLTAAQAVDAMVRGVEAVISGATIDCCPLADGGEGTVEAMILATRGTVEYFDVCGPLPGTRVRAPVGFLPDGTTAIIELATASGLLLLPPEQHDPTRTTTFGTGELMKHAVHRGAKRIILGIGGSATCDAGLGIAQAWGAAVRMQNGKTYAATDRKLTGGDLGRVINVGRFGPTASTRIIQAGPLLDTGGVEFVVACDVGNPLYGPAGAAHVFAPQKGATLEQVEALDRDLHKFADRLELHDIAHAPGAGAAGGVGFAMMAFFGAKMVSGADLIFDAVNLRERVAMADLCLTGEGRFDTQSFAGKTPIAVARLCRDAGVPCVVLAGSLGEGLDDAHTEGVTAAFSIIDRPSTLNDASERAAELLQRSTEQVLRLLNAQSARHVPSAL